ncbi:DUF1697 domain-containing protein [Pseudonocardia broussonetiae]|uniref:DUF1697 domain-containing protein n=1 Tax=Pseudonocardia broussonetiae TaxID=2736640 RepID=A0A6M6JV31_9PSEU|nr:DUF1697 domain-containing protein [Pseudonocardia broussonetiae]QJY49981.1 DUF1697 domain-containing protein [Pseudonocardia broussonetiae]
MPTHVALLRGINVGKGNRVAMADLRDAVASLGHTDVKTYINSGNVVFTSGEPDPAVVAEALEATIAEALGLTLTVVVLTRAELAVAIENNPYPDEPDPKKVHAVFRSSDVDDDDVAALAAAQERAAAKGSRDTGTVRGRVLYLHLPDGMGRSELAVQLGKLPRGSDGGGTARNWATVRKLAAMLDA